MHARSRTARLAVLAGVALLGLSARPAFAQQALAHSALAHPALGQAALAQPVAPEVLAPASAPAEAEAPARATGPTADAARAGVSREASDELRPAAQRRAGLGRPIALMVVGGAALLTGLIIGDDAGMVIAVGGALVGLVGLYQYLQ